MVSVISVLAALAVAGSGAGYFITPWAVKTGIGFFVNLKESGMVFPAYMNPPFASTAIYYIYEIKNPKDVLQGARMSLNVRGPFLYSAFIKRDNIAFKASGERVRYDSHRLMFLDEEKSANLDEKFWMLNPIVPSTLKTVKTLILDRVPFGRVAEPIVFNSVNVLLDNYKERLIIKRTARVLLEGRKIQLLESLTGLANRFGLASLLPPGPPENTFGVAHFQNVSVEVLEIWTGTGNTKEKFGEVYEWRGKSKMTIWKGRCNEIEGTNGELYKPFIISGKPIKIFLPQLCRSFYLDPVSNDSITVQDGLKAFEYEVSGRLFLGARSNPRNKC